MCAPACPPRSFAPKTVWQSFHLPILRDLARGSDECTLGALSTMSAYLGTCRRHGQAQPQGGKKKQAKGKNSGGGQQWDQARGPRALAQCLASSVGATWERVSHGATSGSVTNTQTNTVSQRTFFGIFSVERFIEHHLRVWRREQMRRAAGRLRRRSVCKVHDPRLFCPMGCADCSELGSRDRGIGTRSAASACGFSEEPQHSCSGASGTAEPVPPCRSGALVS